MKEIASDNNDLKTENDRIIKSSARTITAKERLCQLSTELRKCNTRQQLQQTGENTDQITYIKKKYLSKPKIILTRL